MSLAMRHTGIVVPDLDAALAFYGDLLGFVETTRIDERGDYLDNMLAIEDARVTTVKLRAPGGGGLELLKFHASEQNGAVATKSATTSCPGITHIALTVQDLDALYAELTGAGITFNAPPQRSPDGNVKVTYCRDPEGNFVELVEVLPTDKNGFVHAADPDYFELLVQRLDEKRPELTFLAQFRELLRDKGEPGAGLLDVGCATGYGYNSFRNTGFRYVGIDIEKDYLDVAMDHFSGDTNTAFQQHDITLAPYMPMMDFVICEAVLEHLPALEPGLTNIAASCGRVLLLRTFLGPDQDLYDRPAPNPAFQNTHRKHSNQYASAEVCHRLEQLGFTTKVIRDRHTESLPRLVDGVFRTFYIIRAERKAHAGEQDRTTN